MKALTGVLQHLSDALGTSMLNSQVTAIGGGSINQVYRIRQPGGRVFCCKINSATKFPHLFSGEAEGLQQLSEHIRTPYVEACFQTGSTQILLLEWMETASPAPPFWKTFGAALAKLHQYEGSCFGAAANNYMGSVPQDNAPLPDWASFFAQRRLLSVARMCQERHLLQHKEMAQLEKLAGKLDQHFPPTTPRLLHGDLWRGNFLCTQDQEPVLIDPAVYFGHPAVDLGMTTLFGGFDRGFYEAYHYHSAFPENHRVQWKLCNLYPLLIHLLLFGRSYHGAIARTLGVYVG